MEWTGPMMQTPGWGCGGGPSRPGYASGWGTARPGYTGGWGGAGPGLGAGGWGGPGPGFGTGGWGGAGPGFGVGGWGGPGPGFGVSGWGGPGPGFGAGGWGGPGPGFGVGGWGGPGPGFGTGGWSAMPPAGVMPLVPRPSAMEESLPGILAICLMSGLTLGDGLELDLMGPGAMEPPVEGPALGEIIEDAGTQAVMALPGLPLGPAAGDADGMFLWPESQMVLMPDEPVEEEKE